MVKDKAHGAISLKSIKGVMALQYCWTQRRIGTRLQAGRADNSREAAVPMRDFEDRCAEGLKPRTGVLYPASAEDTKSQGLVVQVY